MIRFKPLLIIFALVGFLWACETTDPLVNEVQLALVTGDFETALETVNAAIEEDENNYIAHFYKGNVYAGMAEAEEDPRDRKEYYERSRASFDRAKSIMQGLEETPGELEELEETVTFYWAEEFNAGVEILNDDSTFNATPEPNYTTVAHMVNAATIQPDSALSYQVMASAYFNENDIEEAVEAYEQAMSLLSAPEVEDYEFMVSILLVQENYDRAIHYAEEARESFPDETTFVQLLADAYLQSGRQDEAISLIESLIADDPENPQYRRVLGTQIYQTVDVILVDIGRLYEEAFELRQEFRGLSGSDLEEAESRYEELQSRIDDKENEMDELTEVAIREMKRVTELEPDSESAHAILGIIYQNRASNLFDRRNNAEDYEELEMWDERARDNLREAMVFYERAAEIEPDNPENWQSLFQVYTALGMEEEAEEAMDRAGM
ncbi:MAG: tetratricopeptide repeat protein [Balneolaceae bacterium]|nr:tetratricopeptide repeat protein [Balneolaceae bacterium]MCH8549049.1 tetratricopeptide repeat protein [Balneolaceae bacterium]